MILLGVDFFFSFNSSVLLSIFKLEGFKSCPWWTYSKILKLFIESSGRHLITIYGFRSLFSSSRVTVENGAFTLEHSAGYDGDRTLHKLSGSLVICTRPSDWILSSRKGVGVSPKSISSRSSKEFLASGVESLINWCYGTKGVSDSLSYETRFVTPSSSLFNEAAEWILVRLSDYIWNKF